MAYQNGTALDLNDLLNKLRLFVSANGWTVNFWGDRTTASGGGKALSITKGVCQGTFLSNLTVGSTANPGHYLYLLTHDPYTYNPNPDTQPNSSGLGNYCNGMQGPFKQHWFFEGTTNGARIS